MNLKTWIPLVLAIALGVIAMVVARKVLRPSSGSEEPTTVASVIIMKHDVPPGKELGPEDLQQIKLPTAHAPSRAFANIQDVVGRVPTSELVKGQPVIDTQLAAKGGGSGMQAMIPEGMRGFTIEVNEFSGLAGMILPGARVDIVSVVRDDKQQQPMSRTILQNIKVVAVGRNLSAAPSPDGAAPPPSNNVTLLVTPKQAQAMQLAMQAGRPWLVLRNGRDEKIAEVQVTSMAELNSADGANAGREPLQNVAMLTPTTVPSTQPALAQKFVRLVQVINAGVITTIEVPIAQEMAPEAAQTAPAKDESENLPPREMQTVRNSDEEAAATPKSPEMIEKTPEVVTPEVTETATRSEQPTTQPTETAVQPNQPEEPVKTETPTRPEGPTQVDVPTDLVVPQVGVDPSEEPGAEFLPENPNN